MAAAKTSWSPTSSPTRRWRRRPRPSGHASGKSCRLRSPSISRSWTLCREPLPEARSCRLASAHSNPATAGDTIPGAGIGSGSRSGPDLRRGPGMGRDRIERLICRTGRQVTGRATRIGSTFGSLRIAAGAGRVLRRSHRGGDCEPGGAASYLLPASAPACSMKW